MVKVFGPLMSLDASGTLGNAITFSKSRGRNYVRERVIPSNPQSGAQTGRRSMMRFLGQQWASIDPAKKATWQDLADQLVAAPFNGYVSANMKNWHNFLPPSQDTPIDRSDTPATTPTGSGATWEENRINVDIQMVTPAQNWGIILFASTSTGFTPAVGNVYQAQLFIDIKTYNFYWTPPSVTTWYFRNLVFAVDGALGTMEAEYSAVP